MTDIVQNHAGIAQARAPGSLPETRYRIRTPLHPSADRLAACDFVRAIGAGFADGVAGKAPDAGRHHAPSYAEGYAVGEKWAPRLETRLETRLKTRLEPHHAS